jgi:hypothetical protein
MATELEVARWSAYDSRGFRALLLIAAAGHNCAFRPSPESVLINRGQRACHLCSLEELRAFEDEANIGASMIARDLPGPLPASVLALRRFRGVWDRVDRDHLDFYDFPPPPSSSPRGFSDNLLLATFELKILGNFTVLLLVLHS